ncbi:MAG: glycosyltransferase [Tannerellaceae bacterium]|nr:glycosyltransferase [Tannerellaceae bacterium]
MPEKPKTEVLYISSGYTGGGAYIAAHRIHTGLLKIGIKSNMLVKYGNNTREPDIQITTNEENPDFSIEYKALNQYSITKTHILFSPSMVGINPEKYIHFFDPAIVQLHFINYEFIKIEDLSYIKKPIVWRLPDCWAFTGGCHYPDGCKKFQEACGNCPLLNSNEEMDLSRKVWQRKKTSWEKLNLTIVVPTLWMKDLVQQSSLFCHLPIEIIPNGVDLEKFYPLDKDACRKVLGFSCEKKIILYGAHHALNDPRKGYEYIQQAIKKIPQEERKNIEFVIFGTDNEQLMEETRLSVKSFGYIKEHLILQMIYSAADVMIVPSTEEAFGQTVIEAMGCGTPVIAFKETGPESIIDHKINGYLANYKSSYDLAKGICWILNSKKRLQLLSKNAIKKVRQVYDIKIVAKQYQKLYERILINSLFD